MICPACNTEIGEAGKFCPTCGASLDTQSQSAQTTVPPSPTPFSPQSYQQETQEQHEYQQPDYWQQSGYGQSYQTQAQQAMPVQKMYANTTGTSRALAMSVYWGLLPLIFAYVVGDKDADPFIREHVNNGLIIFIGMLISSFLMVVLIGFILFVFLFVMAIMGTVRAYHGEITPLPLISSIKILK